MSIYIVLTVLAVVIGGLFAGMGIILAEVAKTSVVVDKNQYEDETEV